MELKTGNFQEVNLYTKPNPKLLKFSHPLPESSLSLALYEKTLTLGNKVTQGRQHLTSTRYLKKLPSGVALAYEGFWS